MYDRAPRTLVQTVGSTPQHLGPGSYPRSQCNVRQLSDGYAPFMSLAARDTVLVSDSVLAAPGPGQYDPQLPQDCSKGASSLKSTSQRFQARLSDTPGPAAYHVQNDWVKESIRLVPNSAPSKLQERSCKGNLASGRHVKFCRQPIAPSIPCAGQAYGFEENEDGTLLRQEPPARDTTLGPAYYAPKLQDTRTTKLYKGIHWGSMKSGRTVFGSKDGPGPGEYDPQECRNCVPENVTLDGDRCKFESYIPRYTDKLVIDEKKEGKPGPGQYKVQREFDNNVPVVVPNKANADCMFVSHPPFLTQSKRFSPVKSEVPAPGTYNDPRNALESLKKISSLKRNPFGQTSVRFDGGHGSDAPGPGAYNNLRGMAAESVYKAYLSSTQRGAFGSSSQRKGLMVDRNVRELPGPAHYQPTVPSACGAMPRGQIVRASANFASQTERVEKPPKTIRENPPPGAYDVVKSYHHVHDKTELRPPRTTAAKLRHNAFLQSTARFAPPRDIVLAEADPANPGPGAYEPRMVTEKGNLLTGQDVRFKENFDDLPGPGAYEFSPLIQDTVLKGTFNVTLGNPLMPQTCMFVKKNEFADARGPAITI